MPVPLAGADALPPCAPNVSWRNVRASAFSLEVPCDFLKKPVQGIDSEVGMMESPTMVLSFDHGGYSSTLREFDSWPELRSEQASIGGKDARIITFRGTGDQWASHPFGAAVHFPDVGVSPQGKAKLTILVKGKSATDQATATRIFRSVRFQ